VPGDIMLAVDAGGVLLFEDEGAAIGPQGAEIEIIVSEGGTLSVGGQGASVMLAAADGGSVAGSWGGVTVDSAGTASLDNVQVSGATIAFQGYGSGSLSLDHVDILSSHFGWIGNDSSSVVVDSGTWSGLVGGCIARGATVMDVSDLAIDASGHAIRIASSEAQVLNGVVAIGGSHGLNKLMTGSVAATGCTFVGGSVAGVIVQRGSAVLSDCTVRDSGTGVWADFLGTAEFSSGVIEDCDWGAWVEKSGVLKLGSYSSSDSELVVVQGSTYLGIGITNDSMNNKIEHVRVDAEAVANWTGVQVFDGASAVLSRVSVVGAAGRNSVGFLIEGDALLEAPKVSGFTAGTGISINCDSTSTVTVDETANVDQLWTHPQVWNCRYGIDIQGDSRPVIRNSVIEDHQTCVNIGLTATPDLGHTGGSDQGLNRIQNGTTRLAGGAAPRPLGVPPVPAEDNYWGYTPDWQKISSWVDYQPYLWTDPITQLTNRWVETEAAPDKALVIEAFPSPFSSALELSYEIPATEERVTVDIFDVAGRRIRRLIDAPHGMGSYSVRWDGADASGRGVSRGVYFVRLATSREVLTQKVVHVD